MRRIFWGFCRNRVLIDPLHYLSSRSAFGFEFAEIIIIKQRHPDSASRRLSDSASRGVGESFFDYDYLREYEAQIGTAQNVV